MIRLFNLDYLKPIARIAELLTIVCIILGAICITADVGQPIRAFMNLMKFARPSITLLWNIYLGYFWVPFFKYCIYVS